jgi:hypothetical protein
LPPNDPKQPRPLAAGSRLQSGLSHFITQPKTEGAVAVGASAVLGGNVSESLSDFINQEAQTNAPEYAVHDGKQNPKHWMIGVVNIAEERGRWGAKKHKRSPNEV